MLPLLLVLVGCSDQGLTGKPADPAPFDSGGPDSADSADSAGETGPAPDDSAPPAECPDAPLPDQAVPADPACAGAGSADPFTLVERWSLPLRGSLVHLGADRVTDVDGDGVVGPADAPTLVVGDFGATTYLRLLDGDGGAYTDLLASSRGWSVTVGDVDPADPGAEVVAVGFATAGWSYLLADETGLLLEVALPDRRVAQPFLVDLEGDGVVEALVGAWVLDAATGAARVELAGVESPGGTLAADLDGDGLAEIVAFDASTGVLSFHAADGTPLGSCVAPAEPNGAYPALAVAELDGDPDGEVLMGGSGAVVVCDADGAVVREAAAPLSQPGTVGVGQLDDDPAPELVFGDAMAVVALDDDLSLLWSAAPPSQTYPLALADLDGDGRHEVLVHEKDRLAVYDPGGAVVASLPVGAPPVYSWRRNPLVVDLDGDGRAELVVGADAVHAVTTPDGGWIVADGAEAWPDLQHHPGDRLAGATVPGPGRWWDTPETNTWNATPLGAAPLADLAVAIVEVCVASCDADAVVTVAVDNVGARATRLPATVRLRAAQDGALLGADTVPAGLDAGVRRHLRFSLPAAALGVGVTAELEGAEAECHPGAATAEWLDRPCP